MRPAMVVVVVAALIVALFFAFGVSSSRTAAPARGMVSHSVPGSALRSEPAAALLAPIAHPGQPPTNVIDAVVVPSGTTRTSYRGNSPLATHYDAQVTFRSPANQAELITFFLAAMKLEGWQVFSHGPAAHDPNSIEVLGKIAGTDGYYWEMGVVVAPTTFGATDSAGQTDVTIHLFQIPDAQ
jgi:hypothetical protein